ncbi:hypothetical protein [Ramlibacter albus]|uniref:Uncharacterized protein n=1 Tax=Ramlibacter albus TaxID=2079448 RepID=A0A923S4P6_9BURK|nr:hypothetical protein [Ramlibacter albus]MBC5767691.1 hypothetical protein [Ramlibacter albus]
MHASILDFLLVAGVTLVPVLTVSAWGWYGSRPGSSSANLRVVCLGWGLAVFTSTAVALISRGPDWPSLLVGVFTYAISLATSLRKRDFDRIRVAGFSVVALVLLWPTWICMALLVACYYGNCL